MTTHGTQNTHRLSTIDDLDSLLAKHTLVPAVVKLGGKEYQVRTDLTASEVATYIDLANRDLAAQAFTILVGTKTERDALFKAVARSKAGQKVTLPAGKRATELDAYLDALPRLHVALAVAGIMRASRALAQYAKPDADLFAEYGFAPDEETVESGESSAS